MSKLRQHNIVQLYDSTGKDFFVKTFLLNDLYLLSVGLEPLIAVKRQLKGASVQRMDRDEMQMYYRLRGKWMLKRLMHMQMLVACKTQKTKNHITIYL